MMTMGCGGEYFRAGIITGQHSAVVTILDD